MHKIENMTLGHKPKNINMCACGIATTIMKILTVEHILQDYVNYTRMVHVQGIYQFNSKWECKRLGKGAQMEKIITGTSKQYGSYK